MPVISLKTCVVVILAALYFGYDFGSFYAHLWRDILRDDVVSSSTKMVSIKVRRQKQKPCQIEIIGFVFESQLDFCHYYFLYDACHMFKT